ALAACQGQSRTAYDMVSRPRPRAPAAGKDRRTGDTRPEGMVWINGGSFRMGATDGMPYEAPVHEVSVRPFWMDAHEVTVGDYAEFVAASGYRTEAERFGWSGVFDLRTREWEKADGADWRHPDGPGSSAPPSEPVTQVSWNDAVAYAAWA